MPSSVPPVSRNPVRGANRLKLGIFCANTMPALTTVDELFKPSWDACLKVARLADNAGLEAIVPIARWKGYVDDDPAHPSHEVIEPFTYAAAIAQATRHSAVFATTHAPTVHPLIVAKQAATIDAISGGRFGMNIVGGWNRREFDMFGIELLGHEERYAYLAEWVEIIRRLWSSTEEFDVSTDYFEMKRAISRPHPLQGAAVPIMNAGFSATGMRFAARHSDIGLIGVFGENEDEWARQVAEYKRLAREEFGREIQVWTNAQVVLHDSDREAHDYLKEYSERKADNRAIDSFIATLAKENNVPADSRQMQFMRRTVALGSGIPVVGDADRVAATLLGLSRAGLDGVIMSYVDFVDGLTRFKRDVLPRLEVAGVRRPFDPA